MNDLGSSGVLLRGRLLGAYWIEEAAGDTRGCDCCPPDTPGGRADTAVRVWLTAVGLLCVAAAVVMAVIDSAAASAAAPPCPADIVAEARAHRDLTRAGGGEDEATRCDATNAAAASGARRP
ncbi:hypothetical protein ABZZ79_29425 [Streptomyces sp. NPDC006458]|uniref:hypothetical protein n=1 Tax=Streptomyces sp. NPDC006458 TaxID=3154302 RepID=UPI0033BF7CCA